MFLAVVAAAYVVAPSGAAAVAFAAVVVALALALAVQTADGAVRIVALAAFAVFRAKGPG